MAWESFPAEELIKIQEYVVRSGAMKTSRKVTRNVLDAEWERSKGER